MKDVAQTTFVTLGPELTLIACLDEPRVDAHAIAVTDHGSEDDRADPQAPRDLGHGAARTTEAPH